MRDLDRYDWFEADDEIIAVKERVEADLNAAADILDELREEVGAEAEVQRGERVAGFVFKDGTPPEHWAEKGWVSGRRFFLPKATSKARRELRARIERVVIPTMTSFGKSFGGSAFMEEGEVGISIVMRSPIFYSTGDRIFFGVPKGYPEKQLKKDVSTLRQVPLSEIYAAKEAAEEAA